MSSNSASINRISKTKNQEKLMCHNCGYEIATAQIPGKKTGLRCPQCSNHLMRIWQ